MDTINDGMQYYALIFARLMGLLSVAPVFSTESVPVRLRVSLALLLAAAMYPVTINYMPELPGHLVGFSLLAFGEAAVGVMIGFMIQAIFAAFQVAGEIFSIQIGISFAEVLDPQAEVSIPILGTLKNTIGMLLFVSVDFPMDGFNTTALLHMFRALAISFHYVPGGLFTPEVAGGVLAYMDQAFGIMFITALKIGVPLMGILFISSLTLGILGRAAPQMNLMVLGIQVNIIVGLVVLIIVEPVLIPIMLDSFHRAFDTLGEMYRAWPKAS